MGKPKFAEIDLKKVTGLDVRSDVYATDEHKMRELRNAWPLQPGGPVGRKPGTQIATVTQDDGLGNPVVVDFVTASTTSSIINVTGWHDLRLDACLLSQFVTVSPTVIDDDGWVGSYFQAFQVAPSSASLLWPLSAWTDIVDVNGNKLSDAVYKFPASRKAHTVRWMDKIYVFPGPGFPMPFFWVKGVSGGSFRWGSPSMLDVANDGTQTVDATAWGSLGLQLRPTAACVYNAQFVVAGGVAPHENSLFICTASPEAGILAPKLSNVMFSAYYEVGEDRADPITALHVQSVVGGASIVETPILIFKRHSLWLGKGRVPADESEIGTTTVTFGVQKISDKMGCNAPNTIVETPFGVIWCSDENVWLWDRGPVPKAIGHSISPLLSACASSAANWHAEYVGNETGGIYRLALSTSDNTYATRNWEVPSAQQEKQCQTQLWLDLRRGLDTDNPRWWGPMEIPSLSMYYVKRGWYGQPKMVGHYVHTRISSLLPTTYSRESRIIEYDCNVSDGRDDAVKAVRSNAGVPVGWTIKTAYTGLNEARLGKFITGAEVDFTTDWAVERRGNFNLKVVADGGVQNTTDLVTAPYPSSDPESLDYKGMLADGSIAGVVTTAEGAHPATEAYDTVVVYPQRTLQSGAKTRIVGSDFGVELTQNNDSDKAVGDVNPETKKEVTVSSVLLRFVEIPGRPR